MKICECCEKELTGKQRKFCSKKCSKLGEAKESVSICKGCNKEFAIKTSDLNRGRGNYCSIECYRKYGVSEPRYGGRKRIIKICPVCNKEFETGGRAGARNQIVCSDKCQRASRFRNGAKAKPLKVLDAAYLAGFIDGEGSIMLTFRRNKASVKLSITNTHKGVLDWIMETTGVGNVNQHRKETLKTAETWFFHCNSDAAVSIIQQIEPYLKIKQEQAKLAIETQKRLRNRTLNADTIWQQEYILKMKELNKRGPNQDRK